MYLTRIKAPQVDRTVTLPNKVNGESRRHFAVKCVTTSLSSFGVSQSLPMPLHPIQHMGAAGRPVGAVHGVPRLPPFSSRPLHQSLRRDERMP